MNDYYLKTPDEETLDTLLGNLTGINIDRIGPIPDIPGFHANLRGVLSDEQMEALAGYLIEPPLTPFRVWA